MNRFLSRIFGADANAGTRGLVFAPLSRDDGFAGAERGQVVRYASPGPPWIVVDHAIESVVGARWPGRLWEVEILAAAPESDQPREGAGYTRAHAVRVVRELPPAILFGEHGDDVLRVIDRAASIEPREADVLAARRSGEAREAYSRAWNPWLAKVDSSSYHLGSPHPDTLAVFAGGTRSPIHGGFLVLSAVFDDRVREVAGEAAFRVGEDDELCLFDPWSSAKEALLDAAMALGAPELSTDADRRILLDAWEHCFGRE